MPKNIITGSVALPGGDRSFRYARFGDGARAFVILPGIAMKNVVDDAPAVAEAYRAFTEEHGYTGYLLDRAEPLHDGYRIEDMAEDTAFVMQTLGIREADVFGASQGGMIGLVLAAKHPELVRRLVAGSSSGKIEGTAETVLRRWTEIAERHDHRTLNHEMFRALYSEELLASLGDALETLENAGDAAGCDRLAVLTKACIGFDCLDLAAGLGDKVFVIGAGEDRVLGAEASARLAERIGCGYYLYEHGTHAVYDEAPDYKDRLLAFFRS